MRLAALAIALVLALPIGATAQDTEMVETFDTSPAGWDLATGTEVIGGVLRVSAGAPAFRAGAQTDLDIAVRARFESETIAAVMYHATDAGAYALFLTPGWIELVREDQVPTVLVAGEAPVEPNEWFEVTIRLSEATHEITVAGVEFETTDPNPHLAGQLAFRAEGRGQAEFDDLRIAGAASVTPPGTSDVTWIRTGGPLGGLGYDVRIDALDPQRMYVTDAFAGVFISDDGGDNWYPSNEGITTRVGPSGDAIPVFSLTIDPNDANVLWAGTQHLRGIFKSTDRGQTWVEKDNGVSEFEGITFRGFAVEPGDSNTVYAAAELSSWIMTGLPSLGNEFDMTGGTVYKTIDGGENWTAIWRGNNLARYVWIDPGDTDVVYVSTGIFDREAANSDPVNRQPGGIGVLKSTDGGATWTEMNNGLSNLYVGSLFLHPQDSSVLIAGTGNNTYDSDSGVFVSSDGGDSWVRTDSEGATSVEFAMSDPSIAYAANIGYVRRSSDGGMTWEVVAGPAWGPPGVLAGFPIDLQVDPADPDRIFANNYGGGNFLSVDGGRTWSVASSGYTGAQVRDIASHPSAPGSLFAAARSGLFATNDGGQSWQGLLNGDFAILEMNAVAVDPTDPAHIIAGSNWDGMLLETDDGGTTWRRAIEFLGERQGWRCLEFAPSDPRLLFGGVGGFHSAGSFDDSLPGGGIWLSTDGGASWEPPGDGRVADAHIATLAVHPTNPTIVYAASPTDGLLRSADGGMSWEASPGLPDQALSVAFDPANTETVLAGFQGGIYRSADGGQTWASQPAGLAPEARVTEIAFDPIDTSNVYLTDIFSGVYQSTDGGETWLVMNDGLRTRAGNALAFSSNGRHLYAATEGEGVFRLDLDGTPPPTTPPPAEDPSVSGDTDTPEPTPTTADAAAAPANTTQSAAPATEESDDASIVPIVIIGIVLAAIAGGGGWVLGRRSR